MPAPVQGLIGALALLSSAPAWAADAGTGADAQAAPAPAPADGIHVGGGISFNYYLESWKGAEGNQRRFGDLSLDNLRVDFDGTMGKWRLSAEYRLYPGYSFLHHGWVGYDFTPRTELRAGVTRTPFGLLPYASHNWFFNLPYYVGLEDNYGLGLELLQHLGTWDVRLAFFKNDAGSYVGHSEDSARYAYDVVHGLGQANHETNQGNLRIAKRIERGTFVAELGASAQVGQLYNEPTRRSGAMWAAALHANVTWRRINLMFEAIRYQYNLAQPDGEQDPFVVMGAYDAPNRVARKGAVFAGGVSYALPVHLGPISQLEFYDDLSVLRKLIAAEPASWENVVGFTVTSGPVFTYVDFAMGKHHPWLGPDLEDALAGGGPDGRWEKRLNINFGYYF